MPITAIDPNTALVLIDLQKGIVARAADRPIAGVIRNASLLASAFRAHHLPVALVNVAGGAPGRTEAARPTGPLPPDWTELVGELDAQASDLRITKCAWGAFHDTPLHQQLQARGVTQIVLGGVSTSIGVDTTARQAFARGYNLTLAVDAMADLNDEAHENSVKRIFPRLGETGTTADVLAKLNERRA
jgi:nicotinamidase-related amidase